MNRFDRGGAAGARLCRRDPENAGCDAEADIGYPSARICAARLDSCGGCPGVGADRGLVRDRADFRVRLGAGLEARSEEHTSELQSLMRISYAVFCLQKNIRISTYTNYNYI